MKRGTQFKRNFLVVMLTLFSGLAWSQIDLTVNAVGSPYQFPGDGSVNSVNVQVNNVGPGLAGDGIQLDINLAQASLSFQGNFTAAPWDCTVVSAQIMQCLYQANLNPVSNTIVNIPVISQPGDFNLSPAMSLSVTDVGGSETNTGNNNGTLDIVYITGGPEIRVRKIVWDGDTGSGPVTALPQGGVAEYLLYLDNIGGSAATNVDFSDVLPAGVTFNPSLNLGNNPEYFSDMIGSCGFSGGSLNCNVPNIAAGTTNNLVKIFADVTGNPGDVVTNFADSMFTDGNTANNSDSAVFTITGAPVQVDMEAGVFTTQSSYNISDIIPVAVEVTNNSLTDDADFVTAVINLPNEVVFQSVQPPPEFSCTHDGSGSGGNITCNTDANVISSGNDVTINFNVLATLATNTADFTMTVSRPAPDPVPSNNQDTATVLILGGPNDFILQKTPSVTNVNVGDAFSYQITVQHNVTPGSDAYDLLITDTLPNELSYQGYTQTSSGVVFQCSHDGSPTGGEVSCHTAGAPFIINDSLDMSFMVEAVSNGTVNNTATVTSASDADGNGGNNTSTAAAVNISIPFTSATLSKQAMIAGTPVSEVPLNTDFTYQLNVTNSGPFDLMSLVVVDLLPADVTLINYDGGSEWNCSDTLVSGQTEVSCSFIGNMLVAANSGIDINVTSTNNSSITSITNQMDVTAFNLTGPQSAQSIITVVNPSLNVSIAQTPDPVDAGLQFDYNLIVTNDGTQNLSNIGFTSVLPSGVTYVSSTNSLGNCTENNGTVDCFLGNMLISDVANISITATAPTNPDVNNNYLNLVTLQSPDLPQNITAQWSTQIIPPPVQDFTVDLTNSNSASYPSAVTDVDFSFRNAGNIALDPVNLQVTINNAFNVNSYSSADFNCQIVGQQANCTNIAPIAPGSVARGGLVVRSGSVAGTYQHQLSAQAGTINKSAQVSHTILDIPVNAPDLQLNKTSSMSQVALNAPFEYLFNVSNQGSADATNVVLTDTLPAGIIFDGYTGQGWQCQGTQTISCQYNSAISAANNASELVFAVTAPNVSGVINNQATVNVANDANSSNNSDSVAVEVISNNTFISDLLVNKSVSDNEVTAGDALNWTIDVQNTGPDAASSIQLNDMLPDGFVADGIVQSDGLTCMLLTESLSCEQDTMAVGDSLQVMISGHVNINYEGEMINLVTVSSANLDGNSGNNQSMAQTHVLPFQQSEADVSIQVTTNQSQILQGDVFQMTLLAKNLGPDVAENSVISAQISGLINQINSLNVAPWQCQNNNSSIQCQLPMGLNVSAQHELTFEVRSEQIVQTAEPIQVSANIQSDAEDPNESNNYNTSTTAVTPTPTEQEILDHMEGVMGSMDAQTQRAIRNVSSYCARKYFMALEGLCSSMYNTSQEDHDDMHDMMREITPNEVLAQSNSASEIVTSQFTNIDSRLSELRGGGGGFSVSGLRGTYGNESIPLGMLAYLNAGEDDNTSNAVNDFVSPWGFFINGTISMGERDKTGRELGFDFDTFGITAGLDYRLSDNKVLGVALGYANFDSEIEDEAEMQSDGVTLTGYGSFYINDNFYVDTRISYGQPNFDQSRRINFSLDDVTVDRIAKGSTSANQYSASMSMGYHFYKNAWNITPNASINYINTSINSFKESGAGGFNFEYGQQDIKSLRASLGLSLSRAISLEKGIITPQFDINMTREMQNDGGLIEARFISAPDDEIFWIETDEPDRTFGNAGLGLVFIGANGKQAYINYRSIFGLEGFSRGTINLGLRFEF